MSDLQLTKTRFFEGAWEGVLTDPSPGSGDPSLTVVHQDRNLEGIVLSPAGPEGVWNVKFPVPVRLLGEGAHSFVIADATDTTALASFSIIAGEALSDDIRAEVDLLRAELDMLKRAFRSHCSSGH